MNFYLEKSLTMPKKLKGRTLWDFSTSILSQNSKEIEGDPLVKCRTMPNKLKGVPLVSPGNVCYADINLFGSVSWANRCNLTFCKVLVELFWPLQVFRRTLTKSYNYSRLFSRKAPTKNGRRRHQATILNLF